MYFPYRKCKGHKEDEHNVLEIASLKWLKREINSEEVSEKAGKQYKSHFYVKGRETQCHQHCKMKWRDKHLQNASRLTN